MDLVLGIFLIFGGLVMVIFPEFVFELTQSWKSDAMGTPSRLYIISTRSGGVICVLAGIIAIVSFFLVP